MEIKNILVILGPPGSGKGTQGKLLAPILNYEYVSMGQVLRNYVQKGNELGAKVKTMIDAGQIIPDEWIRVIFHEVLLELPENTHGVILDGLPRDMSQEPILEEGCKQYGVENIKVVFIEVPEEKLRERLKLRGEDGSNRADDNPVVFDTRFAEYKNKTYPLKEFFEKRNQLVLINGDQSIEDTHQ